MLIYTVFDCKTDSYSNLICQETRLSAFRDFSEACGSEGSPYYRSPEDFTLYEIGEWSRFEGLGKFSPKFRVCDGLEARKHWTETQARIDRAMEDAK